MASSQWFFLLYCSQLLSRPRHNRSLSLPQSNVQKTTRFLRTKPPPTYIYSEVQDKHSLLQQDDDFYKHGWIQGWNKQHGRTQDRLRFQIAQDESCPSPASLNADVESSTEEHLGQSSLEVDEFSAGDICYGCGNTEDFCMCVRCEHCDGKEAEWIERLHECPLVFKHCKQCSEFVKSDCSCGTCEVCGQHVNICICPDVKRKSLDI